MSEINQLDESGRLSSFKFPSQVYLILANEICERFSYYGIHAILLIYLTSMYRLKKETSISIYHGFNMLCYMSPLLGAIISDSYLGRYKTILYISIVYTVGSLILAITSIPRFITNIGLFGPLVGLFLIALGTGGIKPCVSTFGADQFSTNDPEKLQTYFSLFYFSINFGSLISMVVTPILRSDVECFGRDCYLLAFGLPAILMVLSIVLFLCGTKLYTRVDPTDNMIVQVFRISYKAISTKLKCLYQKQGRSEENWLDFAKEQTQPQLLEDVKALYRVLLLFLPIPIFWTLFDQQGSRWILQAMEMNGNLGSVGVIKPDQMQAINPILVMILIPIFETIIYPTCRKCNILQKPLTRMSVGMLLAVVSFILAGILQLRMQELSSFAFHPSNGCSHLRIINAMPDTSVSVVSNQMHFPNVTTIQSYMASEYHSISLKSQEKITLKLLMDEAYLSSRNYPQYIQVYPMNSSEVLEDQSYSFIVGLGGSNNTNSSILPGVITKMIKDDYVPEYEISKIRFIAINNINANHSETRLEIAEKKYTLVSMIPSEYLKIPYGSHVMLVNGINAGIASFKSGSIYSILISFSNQDDKPKIHVFGDVEPRPLSIMWQIPQYVLITSGEVLFSITGLDFAYASSPKSMKSFLTAAWLLTVSTGNFVVILFEGINLTDNMATEFFIFAALLFVTTIIFSFLGHFYVPYNPNVLVSIDEEENTSQDLLIKDSSENVSSPALPFIQ